MLSTGRLLCARRIWLDVKYIEGAKCSFHVCSVANGAKIRSHVLHRKLFPASSLVVNFASSDASSSQAAGNLSSTILEENNSDIQVLRELGILPSQEKTFTAEKDDISCSPVKQEGASNDAFPEFSQELISEHLNVGEIRANNTVDFASLPLATEGTGGLEIENTITASAVNEHNIELPLNPVDPIPSMDLSEPALIVDNSNNVENDQPLLSEGLHETVWSDAEIITEPHSPESGDGSSILEASAAVEPPVLNPEVVSTVLPSDVAAEATSIAGQIAAEPSLASIGLGNWTPVGMVQRSLEFFHITLDLPWWGSIALGTLIIRLFIFPLVIMGQRNAAKMNNCLPEMQALQVKMSEARQRGDKLDAAMHAHELVKFMGEKGVNPLKNSLVPLCQAPFFISMFMGIRGMANAPVDSFREGGMYWFTDLTVPDEFYILPIITSATLALTIEVGTDMGKLHSMGMARYVLRGLPLLILPFTFSFPAGVLVYWVSTNFISLVQVAVLRVPQVRNYFNIEQLVKIDKTTLPMQQKGFVGGMKESWTNLKISRELQDRERIDNANFQRAGRGAVKKTYKFDPTQPQTARKVSSLGIQVKSRDS